MNQTEWTSSTSSQALTLVGLGTWALTTAYKTQMDTHRVMQRVRCLASPKHKESTDITTLTNMKALFRDQCLCYIEPISLWTNTEPEKQQIKEREMKSLTEGEGERDKGWGDVFF